MKRTPTRIIGIGNPLMGDDGVGNAAVERLGAMALPEGVEALDGGTGGLTLLYLMEGAERVCFIDAVAMGEPAGTVRRFDAPELGSAGDPASGLSLHETGLLEVLAIAGQTMNDLPQITLYGIEPQVLDCRLGLSAPAEKGLASAIRQLLDDVSP